jgi:two-component system, chemotaxis family, response regulator PixG
MNKLINTVRLSSTSLMSLIELSAPKQTELFDTLKQRQFSGQIRLTGEKKQQWTFYLSAGSIIYVTGGIHPVRRWQRNLTAVVPNSPNIPAQASTWQSSLTKTSPKSLRVGWEYQLLCYWVDRQEITLEQATKIIWSSLVEVLFDLNQIGKVSYELREDEALASKMIAVEASGAIAFAEKMWHTWTSANATKYSPHMALAIEHPDKLQKQFSGKQYQSLIELGNGQSTLHDLAVRLKRDVVTVARLFLPYVETESMRLVDVTDFPMPVSLSVANETPTTSKMSASQPPLIACVDDSPLICYFLETIIKQANCRFVAINDPLKAIEILPTYKPDLIFLDLVMPKIDGYEVCTQLRKLPEFRRTPIVILTGNDGLVDRVKAKFVGASSFINKPVKADTVLNIMHKHLKATFEQLELSQDSEIRYRGRPLKQN